MIMVFVWTCESTTLFALTLMNLGFKALSNNGQMSQDKRLGALNRFGDKFQKVEWVSTGAEKIIPVRSRADMPVNTVDKLRDMDPWETEATDFLCTVTVASLTPNQAWYFWSCSKCHWSASILGFSMPIQTEEGADACGCHVGDGLLLRTNDYPAACNAMVSLNLIHSNLQKVLQ